jgi:hypothetical protein
MEALSMRWKWRCGAVALPEWSHEPRKNLKPSAAVSMRRKSYAYLWPSMSTPWLGIRSAGVFTATHSPRRGKPTQIGAVGIESLHRLERGNEIRQLIACRGSHGPVNGNRSVRIFKQSKHFRCADLLISIHPCPEANMPLRYLHIS